MDLPQGARVGVRRTAAITVLAALASVGVCAPVCAAQQTHALIVTGLGGEATYSKAFQVTATALYDAAKARWLVADSSLIFLSEDPAVDPKRMRGKSTKEEIQAAFLTLSHRVAPGDVVVRGRRPVLAEAHDREPVGRDAAKRSSSAALPSRKRARISARPDGCGIAVSVASTAAASARITRCRRKPVVAASRPRASSLRSRFRSRAPCAPTAPTATGRG